MWEFKPRFTFTANPGRIFLLITSCVAYSVSYLEGRPTGELFSRVLTTWCLVIKRRENIVIYLVVPYVVKIRSENVNIFFNSNYASRWYLQHYLLNLILV
jgi:hypothetical protein